MISAKFWVFVNVLIFGLNLSVSQPVGSSRNSCNSVLRDPFLRSRDRDHRIVGSFETTIEDNPWQVSLQIDSSHICGGSIIGEKWILTAAQCLREATLSNLKLRVGSSYHGKDGSIAGIKRIIVHGKHSSPDYDFALLELSESLRFTGKIKAVALPNADIAIADGTMTLVSGWGDKLRAACVPIANQVYCNKQYRGRVTDRMICAGYEHGGKDGCLGDSGSPLLTFDGNKSPKLIGVVSWGRGCARPNYPGVYARVSYVRSWIKEESGI